ncbi:uncharacterized protein LOC113350414 [Papaver somniferum]|uniref:uncharacterized protein LOC113350414 n=1 Tax=Papaver somniferum TaxID=3469 RepID=UPI000E6FA4FC|nr:uncharacterized protein LOC113350414 [Papaver somniferum]
MKKLKELKRILHEWNWKVFGNVHVKLKEAENKVKEAMQVSNSNPSNSVALEELVAAQNDHANREVQLNTLMRQKSRVKWIQEGAANTSFFHTNLKIRSSRNMISELEDSNGNVISDQEQIADNLVNHFKIKFEEQGVNIKEELLDVVPQLSDAEDQKFLDEIPSIEEIEKTVFDMDPESSPVQGARNAIQFRPIGLSNVLFKIFTKIITTRMSSLMVKLISPQQPAYIKGRSIQEKVMLASELVNEMKIKKRGGNVGLKLDISQAYDSVNWEFLIKFLRKYGFSSSWCDWLMALFQSARISFMVNGGPCGFFSVGRGLRQGYPLSPILFVLMEDVLSRNISKLVGMGRILPMVIRKGVHPTHLFFADDVFIFCNCAKKSLKNLLSLLDDYQLSSGQVINKSKSNFFVDGVTTARKQQISEVVNMELSHFSDKYLGVFLAPGRVTSAMVWLIVEQLQIKLAAWKGKLLSFQDRVILVKKFKIISWKRVCTPFKEGGLGIHRLEVINKVLLMKMLWKILNSKEEWAQFFNAKFKDKYGLWITSWKQSSIWKGIKWDWNYLKENVRWTVGNGANISVWFDTWVGDSPLVNQIGFSNLVQNNMNMRAASLLNGRHWCIPPELQELLPISCLPEIGNGNDRIIWTGHKSGNFVTSAAVERVRDKEPKLVWPDYIWKSFLHSSIASNIWKLQQDVYMDDEEMMKIGYDMVSRCCICHEQCDNMFHTLWKRKFSLEIWSWLGSIFGFKNPKSFEDISVAAKNKSPIIKEIWMTVACTTMKGLWFQRNKQLFEEIQPNCNAFKCRIYKAVQEGSYRMKGNQWNQEFDFQVLSFFKIGNRNIKYNCIKEIYWQAPETDFTMYCCVGASFGDPGKAGIGIIARDCRSQVIGTLTWGLGITLSSIADEFAILCVIEWAAFNGSTKVIIQSSSNTATQMFKSCDIPWYIRVRWLKVIDKFKKMELLHCIKEFNFSAIILATNGVGLKAGERNIHIGRPSSLKRIELPRMAYYYLC